MVAMKISVLSVILLLARIFLTQGLFKQYTWGKSILPDKGRNFTILKDYRVVSVKICDVSFRWSKVPVSKLSKHGRTTLLVPGHTIHLKTSPFSWMYLSIQALKLTPAEVSKVI